MKSNNIDPRKCEFCEEQNPLALFSVNICRDHLNIIRGISPVENHHPEGRANSPETIKVPTSIHFILSRKQDQWPDPIRYPSDDPVISIARRIQLSIDFSEYYSKAAEGDSNFLLALTLTQQKLSGPGWWNRGGVAPIITPENTDDE
jgi:hypothetical protein